MDRRIRAKDLLDILRVNIFPANNDEVFLTTDNKQFPLKHEPQIARPVPPVANGFVGQIRPVEITVEQGVAPDQYLSYGAFGQFFAVLLDNFHFVARQAWTGGSERKGWTDVAVLDEHDTVMVA